MKVRNIVLNTYLINDSIESIHAGKKLGVEKSTTLHVKLNFVKSFRA